MPFAKRPSMPAPVRYSLRTLRRSPGFSFAAIGVLGLGIGVATAVATLCYAVLARPLPYPAADRLVTLWQDLTRAGGPADEWGTPANFAEWQDPTLFTASGAMTGWSASLTSGGDPELVPGAQVSHGYFTTLGITPALGRDFTPEEDVPNAARVALLSHALWTRRFGADASIVGRSIPFGGEPHTIVGVLPPGTVPVFAPRAEVFRPLRLNLATPARGLVVLRIVARLRNDVGLEETRSRLAVRARQLALAHPESNRNTDIAVVPLHQRVSGESRPALLVLLGGVALILLIACTNVAGLALARAVTRTRETAIRAALGASRAQLASQQMAESLVISSAAGGVGVLVAVWGLQALETMAPVNVTLAPGGLGSPAAIAGIAAGVTLITAVLFGVLPALGIARTRALLALREGSRTTASSARVRRGLVVAEIALAAVLLAGAGLLLRSFVALQAFDRGFDPDGVMVARLVPPPGSYRDASDLSAFYDRLHQRLRAIPGVSAAAISSSFPIGADTDVSFEIEGRPPRPDEPEPAAWYRAVSADYPRAMGIRIVRGRAFEELEPAPVLLVNETMARRHWPGEDPVGKRLRPGSRSPWFTIVGVTEDVRSRGPAERPLVEMYVPYRRLSERGMWIVLRAAATGSGDVQNAAAARLVGEARQALRDVDPALPLANTGTIADLIGEETARPRQLALLTTTFAGLALLLAAAGVYAILAYAVAQRTSEIGVRMALGAEIRHVVRLVLGDALRLGLFGLAVGVAGAVAAARGIRTVLFGVSAFDPLTLGGTIALLATAVLIAALLPARRAARVDPVVAMRE